MSFRFGFFMGLFIGALIALILTPQPGRDTRRMLLAQARQRGILSRGGQSTIGAAAI